MQVRAQTSLSGQASCSTLKLQQLTHQRVPGSAPNNLWRRIWRAQRQSFIVRAADDKKSKFVVQPITLGRVASPLERSMHSNSLSFAAYSEMLWLLCTGGISAVVEKVKEALPALEEIVDENILDYCTLDKTVCCPAFS